MGLAWAALGKGCDEERRVGLTRVGVKYGRGDVERFVGAMRRAVPSDGGHDEFGCCSRECEG